MYRNKPNKPLTVSELFGLNKEAKKEEEPKKAETQPKEVDKKTEKEETKTEETMKNEEIKTENKVEKPVKEMPKEEKNKEEKGPEKEDHVWTYPQYHQYSSGCGNHRRKLLVLRIPVQSRGGAGDKPEGDEYGFRLHDGAVSENAEAQPDCL